LGANTGVPAWFRCLALAPVGALTAPPSSPMGAAVSVATDDYWPAFLPRSTAMVLARTRVVSRSVVHTM
jgi:hypothetical protein